MSITLQKVATAAKVSRSAASAVLGGGVAARTIRVSDATRRRIVQAADRLGYRSNPLARALRGGKTMTLGVLWSLNAGHSEGVVRDLASRAQQRGYITHLADHMTDPATALRQLLDLGQRRVDAIVVEGGEALLGDARIVSLVKQYSAVTVVSAAPQRIALDQIVHDRLAAVRAVADHLIRTGRRRPLVITAVAQNRPKVDAFVEQFERSGLKSSTRYCDIRFHRGLALGDDELSRELDAEFSSRDGAPDALWCGNDELAAAAMRWLTARGLSIPKEVAVVGFNDSPFANFLSPPLASVARRDEMLAEMVDHLVFSRLENPTLAPRQQHLAMEFVRRESAG